MTVNMKALTLSDNEAKPNMFRIYKIRTPYLFKKNSTEAPLISGLQKSSTSSEKVMAYS